ncbi:hypothetical protein C8N32_11244 [Rhodovulum imhoffii]|uniref:Transmembrane protein n=1 Tax=Rhodovulum imhoffii TaxID=365340 RepID=A0A2T5BQS6_9RHOB|nr:hypothetical protein [Rhodovulum imhoffii]MBK5933878.1 hypothetical protein [Rhodovulum imhoffii]PTN01534.1 hypothetical protein C8N32_11244 [Rhodovulum imhoffii]
MTPKTHAAAGALALGLIALFWVSSFISEMLGGQERITAVKSAILYGLVLLVPAMAWVGASGFRLAGAHRGPVIARKTARMRLIGANGLLVLVPCAIVLAQRATAGQIDGTFYAIQLVEFLSGAVNITLLSRNMRDGLAMRAAHT